MVRRLGIKPSAQRELAALPGHIQKRFARAIDELAEDPYQPRPGVDIRPLRGRSTWRLRVGAYRAIYEVDEAAILFTRFGHRSEVYR